MGWFDNVMAPIKQIANPVSNYAALTSIANPAALGATAGILNGAKQLGVGNGFNIGGPMGVADSANPNPMIGSNASARNADIEAGYKKGKEIFYDDQDMKDLRNRRMDLAKGYNGQELGAMREQARSEVEGERSKYLRQLQGKTAKAGVGGARAAAMSGAADKGFLDSRAEMERKMTMDNANMAREGTDSLQDFLFRQKYGTLGTGLGYGQLGVADRTADSQAAIAAKEPKKGLLTSFLDPLVSGLF